MAPLRTALCLHAQSSDLKFLNQVRNRIGKLLGSQAKFYELADQASNADATLALRNAADGFVVIFSHGNSDYLRGGEYRSRMTGEQIEVEKFITRKDLVAFRGKVVFCMSCESNGLAEACQAAGAIAFVGFDEIPFNRFDDRGNPIGSPVLIKHCQEMIADAVQAALERFLTGRATLDESVDYLRIWIAKTAVTYVRKMESKGVKERKEIAALFLRIREGVKYYGVREVRFEIDG